MGKTSIVIRAVIIAFSLGIPSAATVDIDIKGKIVVLSSDSVSLDSVPGASLFLKNHSEVRCTTDEHGAFRLTNNPNAAILPAARGLRGREIRVRENKNGFSIIMPRSGKKAAVDVFDARGRMVISSLFEDGRMGECFVPLARMAWKVYFVKISIDGSSWVFRNVPEAGTVMAVDAPRRENLGSLGKRASLILDTVVVYLKGFQTGLFDISNYASTDFVGKISLTNSWVNCMGPLITKSRSMIKIVAKDRNFEMGQFCDTIWGRKDGLATSDLEAPMHTVLFSKDFFIDSTEITQGEYDSLMKAAFTGYTKPAWSTAYGMGPNFPAYSVSWDDAVLFCNARSKRDHYDTVYSYSAITGTPGALSKLTDVSADLSKSGYHLPTEAQWEYSCRSGKTTDFFWERDFDYYKRQSGDDIFSEANTYAKWAKNSLDSNYGARPVTDMLPNAYDLYGMAGNVSEWCNDWVDKYIWGPATDPSGPATGPSRVVRGGNWGNSIFYLRITNRYFSAPAGMNENLFKGFRAVRTAGEGE
jgi:formylglycine-generating enzyme required for sulfatase activity